MTPINNAYYKVLDNNEVEYNSYILRQTINTNAAVRLPFRVDIKFYQSGDLDGFLFYFSEDTGYLTGGNTGYNAFGINMQNDFNHKNNSLDFHQPVFHDSYSFPQRGQILSNSDNEVSWIIGQQHFAVIINNEIRYCGKNFPYMSLDLSRETAFPIVMGSSGANDRKILKSVKISQLVYTNKNKIEKEGLTMITRQSNNMIPTIHRLVTDEYGENYWFNGSAKYVMECLGEKDYDYWFFAVITGDVFTQHYKQPFMGDSIDTHYQVNGDTGFFERIFEKCGYDATFVLSCDLRKNKEMYLQTLIAYIDKGIPVISMGCMHQPYGVFVGYEEYGKTLLYISGNGSEPQRISSDDAAESKAPDVSGWIFVGEKKEQKDLAKLYRDAIFALPKLLTTDNDKYCFGTAAFRRWADDVENGHFDGMKSEDFDGWPMYTNFICVLATNGCCCHGFLDRAKELNPDMTFLDDISKLYRRTGEIWNNDNGNDLEALGGGFNVTLEALQNPEKRTKIAARIRECGDIMDKVVRIINENIK